MQPLVESRECVHKDVTERDIKRFTCPFLPAATPSGHRLVRVVVAVVVVVGGGTTLRS